MTRCPHGKKKTICLECEGGSYCVHRKLRTLCSPCRELKEMGISLCLHGLDPSVCIACFHIRGSIGRSTPRRRMRGATILESRQGAKEATIQKPRARKLCIHSREKNKCVRCAGPSFCEHRRVRSICPLFDSRGVKCGGGSICIHGKIRSKCRELLSDGTKCGGGSYCEHDVLRRDCDKCRNARELLREIDELPLEEISWSILDDWLSDF